ncbi:hypothetical protein NC652_021728 [Populus alba x Populus x berolinensis]|nr:hypothetical protein NC652_021728 [Populus alba x Populus x berolinensis]
MGSMVIYGNVTDVFKIRLGTLTVPQVKEDQVLIKVCLPASINPVDAKRMLVKFKASDSPVPDCSGL